MKKVTLHFFPFSTYTKERIDSFDNVQGLYVESFPEFLSLSFASVPGIRTFFYGNNISEFAGKKGFSNWTIDSLISLAKGKGNPMEGYGITGTLYFAEKKSFIKLVIIDLEAVRLLKSIQTDFELKDFFKIAVNATANIIIHTLDLQRQLKEPMPIHKSLLESPEAFLCYLRVLDMKRKWQLVPEQIPRQRVLAAFQEGFGLQPDFPVLEEMLYDFVRKMPRLEVIGNKPILQEINGMIRNREGKFDITGMLK